MTEKEKRNRGELYNPILDHELQSEMLRAKELCHEYNMLPPSDGERKSELVRKVIGRMGEDCSIISPFWCDYGYNIETGDHFTANHNCVILDGAKVTFGNYVYVGPDCGFYTAGHPLDVRRRNADLEYARPIKTLRFENKIRCADGKYRSEIYVCRSDERGKKLDRKALHVVSIALGHNREDTAISNYIRNL